MIILASASPRRQELLKLIVPDFSVVPAQSEADLDISRPIDEAVEAVAFKKAQEVAAAFPNDIVIGADTIVAIELSPDSKGGVTGNIPLISGKINADIIAGLPSVASVVNARKADINGTSGNAANVSENDYNTKTSRTAETVGGSPIGVLSIANNFKIFGKPSDEQDATEMLKALSGKRHFVYTGVCVIAGKKSLSFSEKTAVRVTDMSEREIADYISTGEPFDKAGAYAVQGLFAPYIEGISGDYYNIVGLPICKLKKILNSFFL